MSTGRFDALRDGATRNRDLGSAEVWDRSLARSRQRRRLHELSRRARRRRKGVSLAVSAAMAGGPAFPQAVAAATGGSGSAVPGAGVGDAASTAGGSKVVLELGSQGALVAAAQRRLNETLPLSHLAVDGIYGPLTTAAVRDFERRQGLLADGMIDAGMWAKLFDAPVLVFGAVETATSSASTGPAAPRSHSQFVSVTRPRHAADPAPAGRATGGSLIAGGPGGGAATVPASAGSSGGGTPVSVITPAAPTTQPSTYVLTNGVALPLPRQYLTGGYVDQGVDYSAPGGTPEYAMGDGVIIGEGISGFGPNAPILKITSGPLAGLEVYYGHAGTDSVRVGDHVRAGQQITQVGYGIVGISTGPHLEVGFYPPGGTGAGSKMLSVISALLKQHPTGRAWGSGGVTASAHVVRASAAPSPTAGPAPQPPAVSAASQPAAPNSAPPATTQVSSPSSAPSAPTPASSATVVPASSPTSTTVSTAPATTTSTPAPAPSPAPAAVSPQAPAAVPAPPTASATPVAPASTPASAAAPSPAASSEPPAATATDAAALTPAPAPAPTATPDTTAVPPPVAAPTAPAPGPGSGQ